MSRIIRLQHVRLLATVLAGLFFAIQGGAAQFKPTPVQRSGKVVTAGGMNYYLHEVLQGQTLYGICKEYEVSVEEVRKLNPVLNEKMPAPGMTLRIPVLKPAVQKSGRDAGPGDITHVVKAKETLYSISKQYGIKVDELKDLNPDTRWGLKAGMTLKIPQERISIAQEMRPAITQVKSEKAAVETELMAPDQPCRMKPTLHDRQEFCMVVLLPLNLNENDTITYSDSLKAEHFRFYEFLEGVYLAVDSLRHDGLSMTIKVYDTEKNPATVKDLINRDKLEGADLVIGPVFPNEMEAVSDFCQKKRIPMVSPFSTFDLSKGNPYAFQVRTKVPRQVELAAGYIGSKYRQNVILVGRLAEKSDPEFIRFQGMISKALREKDPSGKASLKTVYFSESTRNFRNAESQGIDITGYLGKGQNYFVLSSENEIFTTEAVNELNKLASTNDVTVFGLNQWVFRELDMGNLYQVNLELYTDFEEEPFVDYNHAGVSTFCEKYRSNWNIQPSKYSFQGFDLAYYFSRALLLFGSNLAASAPCWDEYLTHPAILTPLKFTSAGQGNGFVNQAFTVIRYQKDELTRKRVN